jgi:hypothetical protein
MYEVMYFTSGFADLAYYKNGKQPLVYSFGDPSILPSYLLCVSLLTLDTVPDMVRTAITSLAGKREPFSA